MYQPRQQIGRTASTYMPSWANEGRNIPIPGLSFYPILPLSMEREIKQAGDKRRANEKAITALKKRGIRRFVGGMAQGQANLQPERAIYTPERVEGIPENPDDEFNLTAASNALLKMGVEIEQNPIQGLQQEEQIKERARKLRKMDLNRYYIWERLTEDQKKQPQNKVFKSSATFFNSRKAKNKGFGGMYGLSEDWKKVKDDKYTERIYGTKKSDGLLQRIRKGEETALEKGILNPDSWLKTKKQKDNEQDETPIGNLEEFDEDFNKPNEDRKRPRDLKREAIETARKKRKEEQEFYDKILDAMAEKGWDDINDYIDTLDDEHPGYDDLANKIRELDKAYGPAKEMLYDD